MILQEVEDVNTSVAAALVAEDDVLLLEAAANANVEVLVPLAVLRGCPFCHCQGLRCARVHCACSA